MNTERRADSDIRAWLALLVLFGGGYLLANGDADLRMVVASMVTMVLSYYFGSSQSNQSNRNTIDKMVDANAAAASALAEKVPVPPAPPAAPQPVEIVNPQPVPVDVVHATPNGPKA